MTFFNCLHLWTRWKVISLSLNHAFLLKLYMSRFDRKNEYDLHMRVAIEGNLNHIYGHFQQLNFLYQMFSIFIFNMLVTCKYICSSKLDMCTKYGWWDFNLDLWPFYDNMCNWVCNEPIPSCFLWHQKSIWSGFHVPLCNQSACRNWDWTVKKR